MSRLIDASIPKFLLVGVGNTLLSMVIMFLLRDLAGLGYWGATAPAYLAGAVMSFFLNRSFTFRSQEVIWKAALKFTINVAVCYLIANSLARPAAQAVLSGTTLSADWVERISMLLGMVLYTGLNYLGQRFFAFRTK